MKTSRTQQGFTLLEVMVVVIIIATMSGLSLFALNQATDRRYLNQADRLLAWFQQVSELAMLEGVNYGLVRNEQTIHSMVFYRQRWHQAAHPEPFQLYDDAVINLSDKNSFSLLNDDQANAAILPDIVILPNGYLEPALPIELSYFGQTSAFNYSWDDDTSSLVIENQTLRDRP